MLSRTVYQNTDQRIAIFVDVQNMFYSAKTLHKSKIDYSKLLEGITQGRHLVRAIAYVIQKPDVDQSSFLDALQRSGFEVKTKELRVRSDGTSKGDWDMGIALDTMTLAEKVDTVVLVTGDGDFVQLVRVLSARGCRVEVVSFHDSTSNELARSADQFIPIEEDILFKERKFLSEEEARPSVERHPAGENGAAARGPVAGAHVAYDPDDR